MPWLWLLPPGNLCVLERCIHAVGEASNVVCSVFQDIAKDDKKPPSDAELLFAWVVPTWCRHVVGVDTWMADRGCCDKAKA